MQGVAAFGFLRRFRSLFAWETRRDTGVWLYQENTVTGARRIVRIAGTGYQPCDFKWLDGTCLGAPPLAIEHFPRTKNTEQR
jgi:hypothetical protein